MRLIVWLWFGALVACAQPGIVVQNAASFRSGQAAPGSLIVFWNVPVDAREATVTIQPAGNTAAIPVPLVEGWIALLPDKLPSGPATLQLTAAGQTIGIVTLTIVASSFGLFTQNNGRGPVLAQNSLTHPARPGDYVTLWGTGLGSASQDQVQVLMGGHLASVEYAGPAPGYPGTDQINFQVPHDPGVPFGCYVSISVRAAGVSSNTATLSTSADGSACASPLGFSSSQEGQLDAGQSLFLGQVDLFDMVAPPSTPWFQATGYTRMESAEALSLELNSAGAASILAPLEADDAYYSCSSSTESIFFYRTTSLDVGEVTLSNGSKSLSFLTQVQIASPPIASSADAVAAPFFSPGEWTVSLPASTDLLAATGGFKVPKPVQITNAAVLTTIDRAQDLTIEWNGGDYTADYTATLQVNGSSILVCRAPANAGTLTVPAALLETLTPQAGWLELLLEPRTGSITTIPVLLTNGEIMPVLPRNFLSEVIPVTIQ